MKRAESLVQAHPQSAVPLLLLARIHIAHGSMDKAEPLLVKALDLDPNASAASLLLAQLYVSSGRRDEALRKLEPVVERDPGNISALLQIAWIQQDSKEYAKSRQTYEKVLAAQPNRCWHSIISLIFARNTWGTPTPRIAMRRQPVNLPPTTPRSRYPGVDSAPARRASPGAALAR